ncbi:MAG: fused MFS/spermidine synthase [Deltaproteobacteria bacterium]|nr:fused MFS/spermidine synthase [Deltaproteobacteria bacterium]
MPTRRHCIAFLLFFSGLCALTYQVVWLRELRLVVGASTPSSAAVLAVFMGGLGYGSLLLGGRADRAARPLGMYSLLEAGIAALAALTPLLLAAVRALYVAMGGTTALGMTLGTLVRLVLSALVLLPPTLLMGGTLPAAARAATGGGDAERRATALLYGTNTLGAVAGAAASTFMLLEVFGTRLTLWLACLVNALVALGARALDRSLRAQDRGRDEVWVHAFSHPARQAAASARRDWLAEQRSGGPGRSVLLYARTRAEDESRDRLGAAGAVGFVFLLMELVWYRMLSPLLGGTSYTFGLILAVALAGIGAGGLVYGLRPQGRPPRLVSFAASCGLEAAALALPYALGDRVALLAIFTRSFGAIGLGGHAIAWSCVCAIVVLPAALVAGYQFPLLVALLGAGRERLGRHVGLAYATNTAGAILGSLCGGFWLLPDLSAPGAWRLAVWLLLGVGLSALALDARLEAAARVPCGRRVLGPLWPAALLALTVALLGASRGPTGAWRHSPIGAARADDVARAATPNSLRAWLHSQRHAIGWEVDGRESSIALSTLNDTAFLVNGKSDGAAILDAGTQVMGGLLGALLHPAEVRRALVIGLGSGSTAGWLGALGGIEAVDVVEIEPAMAHVARVCAPVNHRALDNPKVRLTIGDAREVLLTTPERYDLIFSEPSNPYRAGVASLFTREFYEAARARLRPGGLLVQWVQAYEIDARSMRIVLTTLSSVFPSVEIWRSKSADLLMIGRGDGHAPPVDIGRLRARIGVEPMRSALLHAWRAVSVEDVLGRYVARDSLARAVAQAFGPDIISTDDRNLLEFSVARALGGPEEFGIEALLSTAGARGELRPEVRGEVDWTAVDDARIGMNLLEAEAPAGLVHPPMSKEQKARHQALGAWLKDKPEKTRQHWLGQPRAPRGPLEVMVMADAYAVGADERALGLIEELRAWEPTEAKAILARWHWARGEIGPCLARLEEAMLAYRADPWPSAHLMANVLALAPALAQRDRALVTRLLDLVRVPLALESLRYLRESEGLDLTLLSPAPQSCVDALLVLEPDVPWTEDMLAKRARCYERARHPLAGKASEDLRAFVAAQQQPFSEGLLPVPDAGR